MPVTHPPAGRWTFPGTAQTTAQFLHQCMSHSDSSLACVRRVVTLSCWNDVVLAYTPWSSTPLQCGHLTGQPVSLTQHFFVEFLQGTANVCECVCTSHGGLQAHLILLTCVPQQVLHDHLSMSPPPTPSSMEGEQHVNMLRHSPDCTAQLCIA